LKFSPRWVPFLALLSGVPGLVYQVVWTREVGLLAGSQIEAVSVVVATFFGGLAVGAAAFGNLADRTASPLRLYAGLELASGAAAALSTTPLRALGADPAGWSGVTVLAACAALLFPISVLLGGTLPALLRAAASRPEGASRHAGRIVGANTLGAVIGVAIAVAAIPEFGLTATVRGAGGLAVGIGLCAFVLGTPRAPHARVARGPLDVHLGALVAAAVVGASTLGTEVLATRLAMLHLGSSLYAWGIVLGLFLAGLALGNLAFARRAERSSRPAADFGWLETAAAVVLPLAIVALRPSPAVPPAGLAPLAVAWVAATVFPPAFLMGGAFPLLVRLAVRDARLGAGFGAVSAANTAGGVVGALWVPFAMLPAVGSSGSACALAGANAVVGWLWLGSRGAAHRVRNRLLAAIAFGLALALVWLPRAPVGSPWVIFAEEGRQSNVVVTSAYGQRTLWVDGESEASTAGNARRTEILLAVLPLLLHPDPHTYLEVGLGSGITLGTASRFGLERLECVEIAESVIRAAALFAPDNHGAAQRKGDIFNADARVFLAGRPDRYDVVSANTLHPWSVGATGLYSREYFERIAATLRTGGIVAQWVPVAQIGADSVAAILATFFSVFSKGGVWWAADNLILVGSESEIEIPDAAVLDARLERAGLSWSDFGLEGAEDLTSRRLAGAAGVRAALSGRALLRDDRPVLEHLAARGRTRERRADVFLLLAEIARDPRARSQPGAALWLESLEARARGESERADRRERLAAQLGFAEADRERARRLTDQGQREFAEQEFAAADRSFRAALALRPDLREARLGRVAVAAARVDLKTAGAELEAWLDDHPMDAAAWNELAAVRARLGEGGPAREAIGRALEANPFYPEALANAGLMAWESGDRAAAEKLLERLRALGPTGASPEERTLAETIGSVRRVPQRGAE